MLLHLTGRRAGTLALLSAATLIAAVLPADGAAAAGTSTITVSGTGSSVKLSGTKGLKAGWVRLKVSSTDDIWFFTAHASPNAVRSGQRVHKAVVRSGTTASDAAATQASATDVATAEHEGSGLGGGTAQSKSRTGYFTIKLPQGNVFVEDLNTQKILATLSVGKAGSSSKPHASARITEGANHVLNGPSTLPGSGTVEISNTGSSGGAWHDVGIVKLVSGATKADVVNFFAGKSTKPPVATGAAAGIEPLAPGLTEYVQYTLSKGTYAVIDVWEDDKTGAIYAAEGSVKIVKIK